MYQEYVESDDEDNEDYINAVKLFLEPCARLVQENKRMRETWTTCKFDHKGQYRAETLTPA